MCLLDEESLIKTWLNVFNTEVGNESLPQVKEFKYLGVLFSSEGTMEREMGRRVGAAGAVLQSLYRCDEKRAEPEALCLPGHSPPYPHLWSWRMGHDPKNQIADTSVRDGFSVRGSVIREGLGVEPLLLRVERSQLRWFGHLVSRDASDYSIFWIFVTVSIIEHYF